ncbi:hypothetical protein [Endozoicomonas sp. Mp262]|uniref:hypothetical protein n=1 Tax=Endozoicomonas sp. Mp262 TaxID=2919499 RepID=UPI0021D7DB6E
MSRTNRRFFCLILAVSITRLSANPMDLTPSDPLTNPFDAVDIIEPVPETVQTARDSAFCRQARTERERHLNATADLKPGGTLLADDSAICFTSEENLLYVASQEAQVILGPYAPWYLALSQENRERVAEACEVMGFETERNERAYQTCLEHRYKELMGPYEDRYRRESLGYISKRKQMAEKLVGQCHAALRVKKNLLPEDLTFPVAYYDRNLNTVPSWILEEGLLDDLWLKRRGIIKAKDVMQAVLGSDCPGNMVLWATYKPLGF